MTGQVHQNEKYVLLVGDGMADYPLSQLEKAVTQGYWEDNDFVRYWTVFRPLLGEPRLDALITRMNDLRNAQRALLDLPPIELDA